MVVDMQQKEDVSAVLNWMKNNEVSVLNVAGPRASKRADAYGMAYEYMQKLISMAGLAHWS